MSRESIIILESILLFIFILLSVISLAGYFRQKKRNAGEKMLEKQLQIYSGQLGILAETQKEMKIFRHDIRHHLIVLGGLAEDSGDTKVLGYIEEIEGYLEQTGEFVYSGIREIDSMLNYMIKQAKDRGIHVIWKVELPSELSVKAFDLTAILGNLLENAVHGAEKAEEKWMSIFLRADESILYIRIENSCKDVKTGKGHGQRKAGSGRQEHGIGLLSVKSMVDKHNGTLKLDLRGVRFAAEVLLYLS